MLFAGNLLLLCPATGSNSDFFLFAVYLKGVITRRERKLPSIKCLPPKKIY